MESFNLNNRYCMDILTIGFSGLEVKIYDTPAGDIRASQGTFSSLAFLRLIIP